MTLRENLIWHCSVLHSCACIFCWHVGVVEGSWSFEQAAEFWRYIELSSSRYYYETVIQVSTSRVIILLERREFLILRRCIFISARFQLYYVYGEYYETLLLWTSYTIGESALFSMGVLYGHLLLRIFLISDYYAEFYQTMIYLSSVPVNFLRCGWRSK